MYAHDFCIAQDDDEINRLYEQVLDIMAIPERAREPMMSLPNINKWKQICLHKDNIRSDKSVISNNYYRIALELLDSAPASRVQIFSHFHLEFLFFLVPSRCLFCCSSLFVSCP